MKAHPLAKRCINCPAVCRGHRKRCDVCRNRMCRTCNEPHPLLRKPSQSCPRCLGANRAVRELADCKSRPRCIRCDARPTIDPDGVCGVCRARAKDNTGGRGHSRNERTHRRACDGRPKGYRFAWLVLGETATEFEAADAGELARAAAEHFPAGAVYAGLWLESPEKVLVLAMVPLPEGDRAAYLAGHAERAWARAMGWLDGDVALSGAHVRRPPRGAPAQEFGKKRRTP